MASLKLQAAKIVFDQLSSEEQKELLGLLKNERQSRYSLLQFDTEDILDSGTKGLRHLKSFEGFTKQEIIHYIHENYNSLFSHCLFPDETDYDDMNKLGDLENNAIRVDQTGFILIEITEEVRRIFSIMFGAYPHVRNMLEGPAVRPEG